MIFRLEISCDNAAFHAPDGASVIADRLATTIEIERILASLEDCVDYGQEHKLRDQNGNTVGRYWWEDS